jgi:hypothetical protein
VADRGSSSELIHSVPAATTVKATTTKNKQDDEDNQKSVGIHGKTSWDCSIFLRLGTKRKSGSPCFQLFLPVTSSHLSPRSFLIASTFLCASSFIATKAARAAA